MLTLLSPHPVVAPPLNGRVFNPGSQVECEEDFAEDEREKVEAGTFQASRTYSTLNVPGRQRVGPRARRYTTPWGGIPTAPPLGVSFGVVACGNSGMVCPFVCRLDSELIIHYELTINSLTANRYEVFRLLAVVRYCPFSTHSIPQHPTASHSTILLNC